MASFDIVCQVDFQEVTNAVDQARREIGNRYDFKGSNCAIDLDNQKGELLITADDEYKMETVIDILLTRLLKRSVPVKSLVYGKTVPSGKVLKKNIDIQQGLSKDQCKELNVLIKETKLKVQSQSQGDSVRVNGKKKDDLQQLMKVLKDKDLSFDVQFTNYR
ncbi:MAG: YajQ family cyclic di-GMP-binding protein [Deltaproteobacteria bacterium]|nr:YajQ family cyclic di-GMP-binding protein [Deltaproteobacteria bacterium]